MSGLMLGASLGKQIHDIFSNKKTYEKPIAKTLEPLVLKHKSSGRRRYYCDALINNTDLAALLEEKLNKLFFVVNIQVNPQTGSVLLFYKEEDSLRIDALAAFLIQRVFSKSVEPQVSVKNENDVQARQKMSETVSWMNQKVKEKTAGLFDLSSIASFLFIIRGIRKIILYGQTPSGPQMLWWAFSLLRGWRLV
jgi:hypothetical protein